MDLDRHGKVHSLMEYLVVLYLIEGSDCPSRISAVLSMILNRALLRHTYQKLDSSARDNYPTLATSKSFDLWILP